MEDKIRQERTGFSTPLTVGFVGHIPIELLQTLKESIESIPEFDIVFFKTSSGRLWIRASDVLLSTKTIKAPLQTRTHGISFPKFMPHMTTTTKIKAMPFHFPESYKSKKKKTSDPFKKWSSGYRERTWKVPEMKDLFSFPEIKKMKKGLKF